MAVPVHMCAMEMGLCQGETVTLQQVLWHNGYNPYGVSNNRPFKFNQASEGAIFHLQSGCWFATLDSGAIAALDDYPL